MRALPASFRVATVLGIPVRLHMFFVALTVAAFCTTPGAFRSGTIALGVFVALAVVFLTTLAHELGHCLMAHRVGGSAEGILIWPLGGLATVRHPHRPSPHIKVALAGVMVNGLLAVVAGAVILLRGGSLPPFPSPVFERGDVLLTVWNVNLLLGLFNLLPGYPMDGGSALQGFLWRRIGYRSASLWALGLGVLLGVSFILVGIGFSQWLLVFLGLFGLARCHQLYGELREGRPGGEDEALFGTYDFSRGYTSLGEERAARESSREEGRPAAAVKSDREVARERLDSLLDRIAREGLASLSPEDRKFLDDESRRLRSRGR